MIPREPQVDAKKPQGSRWSLLLEFTLFDIFRLEIFDP